MNCINAGCAISNKGHFVGLHINTKPHGGLVVPAVVGSLCVKCMVQVALYWQECTKSFKNSNASFVSQLQFSEDAQFNLCGIFIGLVLS